MATAGGIHAGARRNWIARRAAHHPRRSWRPMRFRPAAGLAAQPHKREPGCTHARGHRVQATNGPVIGRRNADIATPSSRRTIHIPPARAGRTQHPPGTARLMPGVPASKWRQRLPRDLPTPDRARHSAARRRNADQDAASGRETETADRTSTSSRRSTISGRRTSYDYRTTAASPIDGRHDH